MAFEVSRRVGCEPWWLEFGRLQLVQHVLAVHFPLEAHVYLECWTTA